jgi:hypothetical protein
MAGASDRLIWPTPSDKVREHARTLSERDGDRLFLFLVTAAADGRWDIFSTIIEELCDISANGVRVLLENPRPSGGWSVLYRMTGLPLGLFHFFMKIVEIAYASSPKATTRAEILDAARATAEAQAAHLPEASWDSITQASWE